MAPCMKLVSSEEYKALISKVEMFLSGRQSELIKALKEQMQKYAAEEQFEKAARMRDSFQDLEKTLERQKVVYENTGKNEDIISFVYEKGIFALVILLIREGRLIDKKDFVYFEEGAEVSEYFEAFFREYYGNLRQEFPDKIVSAALEDLGDKELYQEWLKMLAGKSVKISYGKTKNGKELVELAKKNAINLLEKAKLEQLSKIREDFNEVGSYLMEKLKLNNFPRRIECYDISHIQGTNTVASMVVFYDGMSKKSAYKRFKVKSTEGKPDDFMSMKEVLSRRLSKLGEKNWEKPDLIIIDGGKGQLSSVMEIVDEFGISDIDFVSLAKREEEVFLPNNSKSIILPRQSQALYLIQRIRDEAHRFAITYHRLLRSKNLKK